MNNLIKVIISLIGGGLFLWAIIWLSNKLNKKDKEKLEEEIKEDCCDLKTEEKMKLNQDEEI